MNKKKSEIIGPLRAGCLSKRQISALKTVIASKAVAPHLLSDLEGCGPVLEFEKAISGISGARFALALSSGTAAIHAALLASDVGPGDEVIVTPYSWPQSVWPVIFTGATPVFADIDEASFNINVTSVAERISPKTKAIIVVHMFGHMADMRSLQDIAHKSGITLIADAAHAIAAKLDGQKSGTWGDMVCYSFGRGKLICGGEGGALVTNRLDLYERAIQLTQHEERIKRLQPTTRRSASFSLNYRMHSLAAVLGLADLRSMTTKIRHRRSVMTQFIKGLSKNDLLKTQIGIDGEEPEPYGIPLTQGDCSDREGIVYQAQQRGVPLRCGPVQVPLHLRIADQIGPKVSSHFTHQVGSCPVAEERCRDRELLVLSALDMDGISAKDAYYLGELLKEILCDV